MAKSTRNCIEPWRAFQFEATGAISPCCSGTITGDYGNLARDLFPSASSGEAEALFNNGRYRELRQRLLTGDLPPACVSCRAVHDEDVAPSELERRVINHLKSQGRYESGRPLSEQYAFQECGGNITNRCNFSCVYCSHSAEGGHAGRLGAQLDEAKFLEFVAFLYERGLRIFNFCGIGELTTYRNWRGLCRTILDSYPDLRLRVISNFGKPLSDEDVALLSRFDLVHVSCDTLNPELYAGLRTGGRLATVTENVARLTSRLREAGARRPLLVFNVTLTNAVVFELEDLFRFAAAHGMFVHISSLFTMEGSVASRQGCLKSVREMDDGEMVKVREVLWDLPRRMKAENEFTNVWEYQYVLREVTHRANAITPDEFLPEAAEVVYSAFHRAAARPAGARLKRLWRSFDRCFSGIYFEPGTAVAIDLPPGSHRLAYRAIWCREKLDGDITAVVGPRETRVVGSRLRLDASPDGQRFDHVLLEVEGLESAGGDEVSGSTLCLAPPPDAGPGALLIREGFLSRSAAVIADRLVESQEPIAIWCAGLRALQLLSNTRLGDANIQMVIDGSPEMRHRVFCDRVVSSPDEIGTFSGKIVITHASSPEAVERDIRKLGIQNETVII